jgi:hypothetical protein
MMFRLRYLFMIVLGVLYLLTGRLALVLANRKRHTKYMPLILTSCGLVGLLVGCIRIGPSRGYNYNELDVVQGELELVVPAEQRFVTTSMSSDGRWLFFISERKDDPKLGHYRHTLIDLEENKRYNLGNEPGRRFWIDHEHLAGNGVMLRVTDMVSWPLERVEQPPYSLGVLAGADHIYAREGSGSYFFVTTDPALPYWMSTEFKASAGVDNEELAAFLADRPHTIIRRNTSYGTSERAYSPDGRYYLASGPFDDPTHNLQQSGPVIYDATTDEPVTFAYKNGWAYYPLGWASDSSGIYVRYSPRSSSGDLLYNRHPIYKLLVPGATPSYTTPVLISLTPNSASAYPAAKPDALYRPALQSSVQGWYIDDVVVAEGTGNPPTPTPTATTTPTLAPTATPTPPTSGGRVTDGLQVLYTFQEGSGTTVQDVSGQTPLLPLTIYNPANVSWQSGGGLSLNNATILTHVVYTRDAAGNATIYVDGTAVATTTISGDFSNWDTSFPLLLGNEGTLNRPWLGEFYLVAIYDQALTLAEVNQNFLVGP